MKPATLAALAATTALGGLAAVLWPSHAISPGRLAPGHARLRDDCLACHAPLAGPARARCVRCHVPDRIGRVSADGGPLPADRRTPRSIPGLHARLGDVACARCHLEHRDLTRAGARLRFTHDVLPPDVTAGCVSCHAADRPAGKLHAQATGACSACHRRDGWKPATFEHDRHFRFDRHHPARCTDCHPAGGAYAEYRCDGCHQHGLDREARRHPRLTAARLAACASCHRSGDEHDVRRDGAMGGDGGGGEGGGGEGRGGEEDDD